MGMGLNWTFFYVSTCMTDNVIEKHTFRKERLRALVQCRTGVYQTIKLDLLSLVDVIDGNHVGKKDTGYEVQ